MNARIAALCIAALVALPLLAQPAPREGAAPPPALPLESIDFIQVMESFERVVKGAPFQAQAVTEITQELADGNRIERRTATSIYRDGAGRVRREITVSAIGPVLPHGKPPRVTVILDPASGVGYELDAESRIARKLRPPAPRLGPGGEPPLGAIAPRPHRAQGDAPLPPPVVESLGRKTIEGVEADGTRTTFTIPAGEIGNEKPIQVVHERWYAPELQTAVLTRRSDPRFGVTLYRLTDIKRSEPAPSLFEIPAGYAIKDEPPRPHRGPGPARKPPAPR